MIKAFLAANAADSLVNQNPMSKYEEKPTSSQNIYNRRRLSVITRLIMEKQNKPK
jgi:hypothetical protein